MPSELLKCTICPKASTKFSDVSHLLTHVGSKGHLAQLHRLQVKSHQDIDCGQKLAVYNQWFQEHGLARMLSERMQQKEHKKAEKKAANQARIGTITSDGKSRGRKPKQPVVSAYDPQPSIADDQELADDIGDADYTPIPSRRRSRYPVLDSSSPKMLPSQSVEDEDEDADDDEQKVKPEPGTPQLKGTRYPGMDLFDAAPEELKRKINQKKDASVLRGLQRNSGLVKPTETVHSAAGTVLKYRHMDDLENDSPVEGEEQIVESSPKRRKSTGRRPKRQRKDPFLPKRRPGRPRKHLETPSKLPSSSVGDMVRSTSRFSPTEDEHREFKLALKNMGRRKKKQDFTVYQDSSPSFNIDGSSETMPPPAYADATTVRPQLAYPAPAFERQQSDPYDPFKLIRDRFTSYSSFPDLGQGKENVAVDALSSDTEAHANSTINPLFFQGASITSLVPRAHQLRLNPTMAVNPDPFADNSAFMPVRNPLMAAFDRMHQSSVKDEDFAFDNTDSIDFPLQYRQPLFAP